MRRFVVVLLALTLVFVVGFATAAYANTGAVSAQQSCSGGSASVVLNGNINHRLIVWSSTITDLPGSGSSVVDNNHGDDLALYNVTWAPGTETGVVKLAIYNGSTVGSGIENAYSKSVFLPEGCSPSTTTTSIGLPTTSQPSATTTVPSPSTTSVPSTSTTSPPTPSTTTSSTVGPATTSIPSSTTTDPLVTTTTSLPPPVLSVPTTAPRSTTSEVSRVTIETPTTAHRTVVTGTQPTLPVPPTPGLPFTGSNTTAEVLIGLLIVGAGLACVQHGRKHPWRM